MQRVDDDEFNEKAWLEDWLQDPENEEPDIPDPIADHID
jgi:hypothetical protein